MSHRWYRLCVDVDTAGNPIGISAELHDGDHAQVIHSHDATSLMVGLSPGPFELRTDAIESVWAMVLGLKGDQLALW